MTVPATPRSLFEPPAWPSRNERGYELRDQVMGTVASFPRSHMELRDVKSLRMVFRSFDPFP